MARLSSRPLWANLWVFLTLLTAFTVPVMCNVLPPGLGVFILIYPIYSWMGAFISWKVYPTRSDIFWTLMLLVWSTFVLMWLPAIL